MMVSTSGPSARLQGVAIFADPTTRPLGDLIPTSGDLEPTHGGAGTREEPGTSESGNTGCACFKFKFDDDELEWISSLLVYIRQVSQSCSCRDVFQHATHTLTVVNGCVRYARCHRGRVHGPVQRLHKPARAPGRQHRAAPPPAPARCGDRATCGAFAPECAARIRGSCRSRRL